MARDAPARAPEIEVVGDVRPKEIEAARQKVEALRRYIGDRDMDGRVVLRRQGSQQPPYAASASVRFEGRTIAAQASGPSAEAATEAVVDRLVRRMRGVVDADVALRNEPRVIESALADLRDDRPEPPQRARKPPEEREIVHRRTYAYRPVPTLTAVADLLDLDLLFLLFVHARTEEDVVVYWRDDGRIGLLHPRGSKLADENDIVVPEPSRYSQPLTLAVARSEMDMLNHRFLYFTDADDGRGKVLYLRYDGDYGLVEPA
jgi:ribosome-associated translation inhibitor RaiA